MEFETEPLTSHERAPATRRFEGKVALITGGSDRGIGGAIALQMASEGASVAIISREEPARLMKQLSRLGEGAVYTAGDVCQAADVRRVIDECMSEFGKIDILVNNAGVEFAAQLENHEEASFRELIDVNLIGAISMSRAVLPLLTEPGGVIVNIASALALGGCNGFSVYSASKAGLIGFTQSLAWELAPKKMRVVAVAPGMVHTPMVHKHSERLTPEVWRQIEACHPLGMGLPRDVAAAVAFLASDDARWITGVALPLGFAPGFPLPTSPLLGG